jgi:hypothetical protein
VSNQEITDPQELLNEGGEWIGAARTYLQKNIPFGDRVGWGSKTHLSVTVEQLEEIAAVAVCADRKDAPQRELYRIHKSSTNNKYSVQNSGICGCFYCKKVFHGDAVTEWIEREKTALCPFCKIDSVIGALDYYPSVELLNKMNDFFFKGAYK